MYACGCSSIWCLIYVVRLGDSKKCTEEKVHLLIPGYNQVVYNEIKDIIFRCLRLKKRLNDIVKGEHKVSFKKYFERINNSGSKPTILSISTRV